MRDTRSIIGLLGALVVALAALFVAGPAQAADASGTSRSITAPAAPAGASAKIAAANAPTTSPAVSTTHVAPGGTAPCASGNLCAVVWDPTTSDYKVFYFYTCNRYSLSYWNGGGTYADHQTGGVTSYFYGQSGNVLATVTPDPATYSFDWTPVWSIRNC
ncbi:hypothetical protein [Streptomyces sp. NPDC058683]|uniref:hypothetical protein n=1 Tax=Streptomyces sp. NPDC058683 TaxID=3346597 RepID=UPI0036661F27